MARGRRGPIKNAAAAQGQRNSVVVGVKEGGWSGGAATRDVGAKAPQVDRRLPGEAKSGVGDGGDEGAIPLASHFAELKGKGLNQSKFS